MAGRVDRRDGAGARQLVFLLPGKHTRPRAASQGRPPARRGPAGRPLRVPPPARSPRAPRAPGARLPACPPGSLPERTASHLGRTLQPAAVFKTQKPEAHIRPERGQRGWRERPGLSWGCKWVSPSQQRGLGS